MFLERSPAAIKVLPIPLPKVTHSQLCANTTKALLLARTRQKAPATAQDSTVAKCWRLMLYREELNKFEKLIQLPALYNRTAPVGGGENENETKSKINK
jgi:hypothetical protein